MYPVLLKFENKDSLKHEIQSINDQLNAIPNKGIGFGLLRYLSQDEEIKTRLNTIPGPQVNFNYLGQFDQVPETGEESVPMRMAREKVGPEQSPDAVRSASLYIVSIVNGGQLHVRWLFSKNLHKRSTIKKLAKGYTEELQRIVQHTLKT